MAMNPEAKQLWLAALRSGEYKQGRNCLRDMGDQYCCLGVLSEVAVKAGVIPAATPDDEDPSIYTYGDGLHDAIYLPEPVRIWAGLEYNNPRVPHGSEGEVFSLASLNDGEDLTFPEIADEIEAHL